MRNRSTIDIVIILLTTTVGMTLVLIVIGAVILKLEEPEIDLKGAGQMVSNITTTIVGALVGFIGGRSVGRMEEKANGTKT